MYYIPFVERLIYKLFNKAYLAIISGGSKMEYIAAEREEWCDNILGTNISVHLFTAPKWYIFTFLSIH
jgi:hypothetical protein